MPDPFKLGQNLPEAALPAWRAYRAMISSKEDHFRYLETLERKYQNGGSRTLSEIAHLDNLLKEHDRCVANFSSAMRTLATNDSMAKTQLIEIIATLNIHLGVDKLSAH